VANSKIIAGAGEHYVAYVLSCFGYISALVREGSPTIDLLASNIDGSSTVGIQVKTTEWAERTRGRGENKKPFELQFPLGHKAIENAVPSLIFCFVDLRHLDPQEKPDVYVIPAKVLLDHFEGVDIRQWSYFRLHWSIEQMVEFKNNWQPIHFILREPNNETCDFRSGDAAH